MRPIEGGPINDVVSIDKGISEEAATEASKPPWIEGSGG